MLSWQNVLNSRQIVAAKEEKLANQGEALCGEIIHIYLSLSNKWRLCQGAINSRSCNFKTTLEKYFWFQGNYGLKRGAVKQTVRFISEFTLKIYIQFWKYGFNMITRVYETKTLIKHISCDCKWKFNSTTCNSNQK